jgi:hypothetical protein
VSGVAETEDTSLETIEVQCEACQHVFAVAAELAGHSEFCPNCGALTDIPHLDDVGEPDPPPDVTAHENPAPEIPVPQNPGTENSAPGNPPSENPTLENPVLEVFEAEQAAGPVDTIAEPVETTRGIPTVLWWLLALSAVGGFSAACVYLFSDTWESRHLQELTNDVNRADALFNAEDLPGAASEYRTVLDIVGTRDIQSTYIRNLIDRSREGIAEAQRRQHLARATRIPTTAPSLAATTQPVPSEGDMGVFFQEAGDRFPHVAWETPSLFRDENQNYRRRQFIVWNVNCRADPKSDPPVGTLDYMCESRISMPHSNPDGAEQDADLINREWRSPIHRVATFQLVSGKWRETNSTSQLVSGQGTGIPHDTESLKALSDLETQVFSENPQPQ